MISLSTAGGTGYITLSNLTNIFYFYIQLLNKSNFTLFHYIRQLFSEFHFILTYLFHHHCFRKLQKNQLQIFFLSSVLILKMFSRKSFLMNRNYIFSSLTPRKLKGKLHLYPGYQRGSYCKKY